MAESDPKFEPLIQAVMADDIKRAEELLRIDKLDPNLESNTIIVDLENHYPLKIAIEHDDPEMLALLIQHKLRYDTRTIHYAHNAQWIGYFYAIEYAARYNATAIITYLKSLKSEYKHAFLIAVNKRNLALFQLLFRLYGRPVDMDYYVRLSISESIDDMFDYFIDSADSPILTPSITASMLSAAARYNKTTKLARLLAHPRFTNDKYMGDAYDMACRKGHIEPVKMMLAAGIDPTYCNFRAIMAAVEHNHIEIVKLLRPYGYTYRCVKTAYDLEYFDIFYAIYAPILDNDLLDHIKTKFPKVVYLFDPR